MKIVVAVVAFAAAMVAPPVSAAVTVNFVESGADVVATTSGTLDLTGLTNAGITGLTSFIFPQAEIFSAVESGGNDATRYTGFSGLSAFGTGGANYGVGVGDLFRIAGREVDLATGYVSGGNISAVTTFTNASFASIGLTPGTYIETSAHDSITVNIGSAVPEPATWGMMLFGLGAVGLTLRHRPKRRTLASAL